MKINEESLEIAKHISNFIGSYAGSMLTESCYTIKSYRASLESYLEFLETQKGIKPQTLSAKCFEAITIEEWIVWLKTERKNGAATCNVRLGSLRTFLKYLAKLDVKYIYLYNQSLNIKLQKKGRREVNGISKDAVRVLLDTPDQSTEIGRRDLVFMLVMYSTACRLNEILSLEIKNVTLTGRYPCIRVIGKGSKIRTIPLLPKACNYLKRYISDTFGKDPDPEAYLFYSKVKGPHAKMSETAAEKIITKYAALAQKNCPEIPVDLHPHQLRHSKATHWLEDGMNIVQISTLLGHSQLETTMIYLEVSESMKRKAMATLETENDKKIDRLWKNKDGSLKEFCFLKK